MGDLVLSFVLTEANAALIVRSKLGGIEPGPTQALNNLGNFASGETSSVCLLLVAKPNEQARSTADSQYED